MTSKEQAKAQMIAFLKTKSAKVAVKESDVISWGIKDLSIGYRDAESLLDELVLKELVETKIHDGEIMVRGLKED